MKQNTIITLGLGAIVYYLWSRGNKPNTNEVIHQTKPMLLDLADEPRPFWEVDVPDGVSATPLPSDLVATSNPINLPNLGIPWKDRIDVTYSNASGGKKACFCRNPITGGMDFLGMMSSGACRRRCHRSEKQGELK